MKPIRMILYDDERYENPRFEEVFQCDLHSIFNDEPIPYGCYLKIMAPSRGFAFRLLRNDMLEWK